MEPSRLEVSESGLPLGMKCWSSVLDSVRKKEKEGVLGTIQPRNKQLSDDL
jgi:hypothetical protein